MGELALTKPNKIKQWKVNKQNQTIASWKIIFFKERCTKIILEELCEAMAVSHVDNYSLADSVETFVDIRI